MTDKSLKIPKDLHVPEIGEIFPNLQAMVPDAGEIDRFGLREGLIKAEETVKWMIEELRILNRRVHRAFEEAEVSGTSGAGMANRRCIAQENAQSDGKLSVKLLDSDGNATGSAIDITVSPHNAALDYSGFIQALTGSTIVTNDKLSVYRDVNGTWYLGSALIKVTTTEAIAGFSTGDALTMNSNDLYAKESTITIFAITSDDDVDQGITTVC